jgi:hypothetical protein
MACARGPKGPFISGAALYAHAIEIGRDGTAMVKSTDDREVDVHRDFYLVTSSRDQVFWVSQVIEHCKGGDPTAESDCTLALLLDKKFTVLEKAPEAPANNGPKDPSIGGKLAVTIIAAGVTAGLGAAGAKCELFTDCKDLLIGGAVLSGLVALVAFASIFTDFKD